MLPVEPSQRWSPRGTGRRSAVLLGAVAVLHVGRLRHPDRLRWHRQQYQVGTQVFSIGLGITAYIFGLRHAFDADHIAAIDNVTRKLAADGNRPKSVGFWFALGHSAMVVVLALLVVAATETAGVLLATIRQHPACARHRRHAGLRRLPLPDRASST